MILQGKEVRESITRRTEERLKTGLYNNKHISIIRLGDDPGDVSYEKSIVKYCEKLGLNLKLIGLETSISTEGLRQIIVQENQDQASLGILVLRPLPDHIDREVIESSISLEKDIDCMNPGNLTKIFKGELDGNLPCTPKAVMESLSYYGIDLEGKNVVIVNRSLVVGKPLSMMMLEENATVTICHSRTENLKKITKEADIVVTALGRAKFFSRDYFTEKSIVIDVGTSLDKDGKLSGDLDFESLKDYVRAISPVPGGIGGITTSILVDQALK